MKYKLTAPQHRMLCEALRRFECFAVRRDGKKWKLADLQRAWTGLGPRSWYKSAVDGGYMRILDNGYAPRVSCWWLLTEAGAKIVLHWHKSGYTCGTGYTLTTIPPSVQQ
jgi:hypothetical protein